MHIKKLLISGFRNFRDQPCIEPFSPGHNVLVGRNGGGKSNYFAAIHFVLFSHEFACMRKGDKQRLMHEGGGTGVRTAFVEITFDNADGRMALESDEVTVRRVVHFTKPDACYLNRKNVTKDKILTLLQSAGLSSSPNPYNFVQQGKVNQFARMSDEDRLHLLRDVAGTKDYNARREESVKLMMEANRRRQEIDATLQNIEERLEELEQEDRRLREYEELQKNHRALEFTLYDKELREVRENITHIEERRRQMASKMSSLRGQMHDAGDKVKEFDEQIRVLSTELDQKEKDRRRLLEQKATLRVKEEELCRRQGHLQVELSEHKKKQTELQLTRQRLDAEIIDTRNELESIGYDEAEAKVHELSRTAQDTEDSVSSIHERRGRCAQFTTMEERDSYLRHQLSTTEADVADIEIVIKTKVRQCEEYEHSLVQEGEAVESTRAARLSKEGMIANLTQEKSLRSVEYARKKQETKVQVDICQQLESEKGQLIEERRKADCAFRGSMPRSIATGLQSLRQSQCAGMYGPLYTLFRLKDPKFARAVEAAAGMSIFHVVVDNDETAETLINDLTKNRGGRLTFIPLSKVRRNAVTYPVSSAVVPLLHTAIEYSPEVDAAMRCVFGRKMLARSLDNAMEVCEIINLDIVTLDGDIMRVDGSMGGGYRDKGRSCFFLFRALEDLMGKVEASSNQLDKERRLCQVLEADLRKASSVMETMDEEMKSLSDEVNDCDKRVRASEDRIAFLKTTATGLQSTVSSDRNEVSLLRKKMESLASELGTPLDAIPSMLEVQTLEESLCSVRKRLDEAKKDLRERGIKRDSLEHRLNQHLLRSMASTLEHLTPENGGRGNLLNTKVADMERSLELARIELLEVSVRLSKLNAEQAVLVGDMERLPEEIERLKDLAEEYCDDQRRVNLKIDELSYAQTRLSTDLASAHQRRDDRTRSIQTLGALSSKHLDRYKACSINQLLDRLRDCKRELKKLCHVNKNVSVQYLDSREQRDELLSGKNKVAEDSAAIHKLIVELDRQREEALGDTFSRVSGYFQETFSALVPQGSGRMVVVTEGEGSTLWTGIQFQVSFTGQGEPCLMHQLSGGQKVVVALALIFAIMRSDPAPFYMFDEVDQALDTSYRTAFARLLREQVESAKMPAQIFTITFRPEIVYSADTCYGIAHQNKASTIHLIDKKHALEFVQEQLEDEERL